MFKKTFIALLGAAAILIMPVSHAQSARALTGTSTTPTFSAQSDLRATMRKLWEEHVSYTRNFITSSLAGLEDTETVTQRLLKNQDDIGNAIKPLYGEDAGNQLASLLREHILIAAEITTAAKNKDNAAVEAGKAKGRANAEQIANLLSSANPNLPRSQMADMLFRHLDFVIAQVTARLNKDWAGDIEANDQGREHMLQFADVLTAGIIKQFPDKFPS